MSEDRFPVWTFPVKDNAYKPVDGDTIKLHLDHGFGYTRWVSLRLKGLNAPESRTRNKLEKKAGLLVKECFYKLIEVELQGRKNGQLYASTEEKPKYAGRIIGRLWIDDMCVNDWLLDLDLAKPYMGGKRGFTKDELNLCIRNAEEVLADINEDLA